MTEVKSPYNFVPAPSEGEVFKPDWANQVSHDIPFSDGESGEITLKITSETPIFIRNGHAKDVEENEFSHIGEGANKRYFIPATSIKGMLRNVLEIMSFSRMKQVDEKPFFGLRDMVNDTYSKQEIRNTRTGWLVYENSKWVIYDCKHDRVRLESLARNAKRILRKVKDKQDIIPFEEAMSIEKYKALGISNFNKDYYFDSMINIDKTGRVFSLSNSSTTEIGKLVLFGSIDNKKYDYIFHEQEENSYELESQSLVRNLLKLNKNEETSLGNYFINELKLTKIPVFFKIEGNKVKHFGFSKLYRLNNGHSIGDLEPVNSYKTRKKDELDLAQLIFGTVDEISEPLKGRVYISHAFCSDSPEPPNIEERVLSSPKPSYYPFYLNQEDGKPYKTYLNGNAILAGFKRYPVHTNEKSDVNHENENIPSHFKPLPPKTLFEFKIRFHNLRKVELGALLSTITFHNTPNLFHNLGGAKPYGFGKVKITFSKDVPQKYWNTIKYFEDSMEEHIHKIKENFPKYENWINSNSLKELFAMTYNPKEELDLVYPQLELKGRKANESYEFNNYKNEKLDGGKQFLNTYSSLNGTVKVKPFISSEQLEELIGNFNLDSALSFSDIQNKISDEIGHENVPDSIHDYIMLSITRVFNSHKDSRKKLGKPYEDYFAKTPISSWLGEEKSNKLYNQLTSK